LWYSLQEDDPWSWTTYIIMNIQKIYLVLEHPKLQEEFTPYALSCDNIFEVVCIISLSSLIYIYMVIVKIHGPWLRDIFWLEPCYMCTMNLSWHVFKVDSFMAQFVPPHDRDIDEVQNVMQIQVMLGIRRIY